MILQVDAGNTRLHWRLVEDLPGERRVVLDRGHVIYGGPRSHFSGSSITTVELASVNGAVVWETLRGMVADLDSVVVKEAVSQSRQCGIENSYPDPTLMGVDRWLAMIAGFSQYPGGVAVVDAGTAVTVDYVDALGHHLGGYILPGLRLMLEGLGRNTDRVPEGGKAFRGSAPGRSTAECVEHGLGWIWSSAAQRIVDDMRRFSLASLVITGGDAAYFTELTGDRASVEPELVFKGLDCVFAGAGFSAEVRD